MKQGLAKYLFEIGQLKRVRRSGWWLTGVRDVESVAEHSYRTAVIASLLAEAEGVDPGRTALLALFHDTAETRVNDQHHLGKSYLDWDGVEERVVRDQVAGLPAALASMVESLAGEARDKATPESIVAKDADHLECLLQALEYQATGADVEEWIQTAQIAVRTAAGKELAAAIVSTAPTEWRRRTN